MTKVAAGMLVTASSRFAVSGVGMLLRLRRRETCERLIEPPRAAASAASFVPVNFIHSSRVMLRNVH